MPNINILPVSEAADILKPGVKTDDPRVTPMAPNSGHGVADGTPQGDGSTAVGPACQCCNMTAIPLWLSVTKRVNYDVMDTRIEKSAGSSDSWRIQVQLRCTMTRTSAGCGLRTGFSGTPRTSPSKPSNPPVLHVLLVLMWIRLALCSESWNCEQYTHKYSTYRVAQHDHTSSREHAWLKSWKAQDCTSLCPKTIVIHVLLLLSFRQSHRHTHTYMPFGARPMFTLRCSTAEWRINTNPISHRL